MSLPLWECGLKFLPYFLLSGTIAVTPFVGVWIEISLARASARKVFVTPFVGVWIEMVTKEDMLAKVRTGHSLCGSVD